MSSGKNSDDGETIAASGKARLLLIVITIVLAVLLILFVQQLEAIRPKENASLQEINLAVDNIRQLIHYLLIATAIFSLVFSGYLYRLARRTGKAGMFPPPGTPVLIKTRVLRGDGARRIATGIYIFAALLWFLILIPIYLGWIVDSIVTNI